MTSSTTRIVVAFVGLVLIAIASCLCGATSISWESFQSFLLGQLPPDPIERTILVELRLPRMFAGMVVGGSLAAAGVGFQSLFRNPLAEPYVIGASSGAALGVAITIVAGLQFSFVSLGATTLAAIVGSLCVVMVVLAIGSLSQSISTTSLLLAGVVIGSLVNAIVSALMFLFDQKAIVIMSWLMGSLAGSHWGTATMAGVVGGMGMLAIGLMSRQLDAYSLGDTASQSLGLDLRWFRWSVIGASSLATAGAVAASGVIGFVGLIAPHLARSLVGPRHAVLLPMSICIGAAMMLIADAIARTVIAPVELPVGIVTAILGCPFFLWLLFRSQRRDAGLGVVA
ncbi:iron complex transport system permease protein [Neorhodopirellula lusitana]|uniref:Iron complex transport system permease protein n=1 Tax=Neorhodopirellula lusitana TaxID=445327 RepID=A0ABY1PVM7_9BACT|nr:iron ABC transporter permease [Neorhodopirellula lusitana]SMP48303.1 iron complex transport system permease protein [Neorhodopirellula lusitana]